jgi:hypothetical protein
MNIQGRTRLSQSSPAAIVLLSFFLVAWLESSVLGPEAQPQFVEMMTRINQKDALGPGVRITGIQIEQKSVTIQFEKASEWKTEVILVDPEVTGNQLESRWFGLRAGDAGPLPPELQQPLIAALDAAFADKPFRLVRKDDSNDRPLNKETVIERLPHHRYVYGFGRIVVMMVLFVAAGVFTGWKLLRQPE